MSDQRIGTVRCLKNEIPAGPPGWAERGELPSSWTRVSMMVDEEIEIKDITNPDEDIYTRVEIQTKDGFVINVSAWTAWSHGVFEFIWDKDFLEQHPDLIIFRTLDPDR